MPATVDPVDATVELYYNGAWQIITDDVEPWRNPIKITRGVADEAARFAPSKCELSLNNRDGKYTPRNPTSPLYELIGPNTPLRVRVPTTRKGLRLRHVDGVKHSWASTPDHSSLDVTDIDIRMEITPDTWRPAEDVILAGRWAGGGDSWLMVLRTDGELKFFWNDGSAINSRWSNGGGVPTDKRRRAIWVTMDVDDGTGNYALTYRYADSLAGPWTTLETDSGTATTIAATDVDLTIGATSDGGTGFATALNFAGIVHAFELRNGIGGTLVADPDFEGQEAGTTSFADSVGRTWTMEAQARITDPGVRFLGEVPGWPPEWDPAGFDAWTSLKAVGVTGRMRQGESPLRSSLYRDLSRKANIPYYVPLEAGGDATTFPDVVGGGELRASGDVNPGAHSDLAASDAIPTFGVGRVFGSIPWYLGDVDQRMEMFIDVPDGGVGGTAHLLECVTGGSATPWVLRIHADGSLSLRAWDNDDNLVVDTGGFAYDLNGKRGLTWIMLKQVGADIDWQFGFLEHGKLIAAVTSGTLTGHDYDRMTWLRAGTYNVDLQGMAIGHIALLNGDVEGAFWDTAGNSLVAWSGETAWDRFERLCEEEGETCYVEGLSDDSARLGAQRIKALLDILEEAADAEMAVIGELRDESGLRLCTRSALENQSPRLTLDYANDEIDPPWKPADDKRYTRNDIVVKRDGGSSHREVLETGAMSVAAIGRYDDGVTLSLHSDAQLRNQAGWRLHLGTVDEYRFPTLTVDLLINSSLREDALEAEMGDLARVINPPKWLPPDNIDQIMRGSTEVIGNLEHRITWNTTPGSPWNVAIVGDRADTLASQLYAAVTDSATTMRVSTTAGPEWTEDAAEFPFDVKVGGEAMTVTNITGGAPVVEDFEDTTLNITITDGGDAAWARSSAQAHGGAWSLESGAIVDGQTSDAIVTVPTGADTVQFWYRVSSESSFDFFRFLIDGVQQFEASGETGWVKSAIFDVSAAAEVTFRYAKDGSVSSGDDAAWVDDVVFAMSQEFTVTRSVNGVVKSHAKGADVRLRYPAIVAP